MTSTFARTGQFSPRTWITFNELSGLELHVKSTQTYVDFYCSFLRDVVPSGITVHFIPVVPDDRTLGKIEREEILLMTDKGKIFMSGLVSPERVAVILEKTAGNEAYTNWVKGEFTPDGNNWRFFTGMKEHIRLFSSRGIEDEWVSDGEFRPINDAPLVAAILQQEFDKIKV